MPEAAVLSKGHRALHYFTCFVTFWGKLSKERGAERHILILLRDALGTPKYFSSAPIIRDRGASYAAFPSMSPRYTRRRTYMDVHKKLAGRITCLCQQQGISYYTLSYRSAVPMTTIMHIIDGSTRNPGVFTIIKICHGLNITIKDFFDAEDFSGIECETE